MDFPNPHQRRDMVRREQELLTKERERLNKKRDRLANELAEQELIKERKSNEAALLAEQRRKEAAQRRNKADAARQERRRYFALACRILATPIVFVIGLIRLAYSNSLGFIAVVGMAANFLVSIEYFLALAGWVRVVVDGWRAWTAAAWQILFALLHIDLPRQVAAILTHFFFIILMAISASERFVLSMKGLTDWIGMSRRGEQPEALIFMRDDFGVRRTQNVMVYLVALCMIFYSSVYGALDRGLDGRLTGTFLDALGWADWVFAATTVAIIGVALLIAHRVSHRVYLIERFRTFLALVISVVFLNFISVYSGEILTALQGIRSVLRPSASP